MEELKQMKEPPNEYIKKNKKYKYVKDTGKGIYLYEDENGFKECFDKYDLNLIPKRKTEKYRRQPENVIFM